MLALNGLQHIDQLLNELEELALSDMPAAQFLAMLCERLHYVTGAQAALVILPADPGLQTALILAKKGELPAGLLDQVLARQRTENRSIIETQSQPGWCSVALRAERWEKGSIVVAFAKPPQAEVQSSLLELLRAFGEVASIKQLSDVEKFLDNRWAALQKTVDQLTKATQISRSALALVNHMLPALGATRITLAERSLLQGVQVIAVSGVSRLDNSQDVVQSLRQLAQQAHSTPKPILRHTGVAYAEGQAETTEEQRGEDGLFPNCLATRIGSQHADNSFLIVEWASASEMVSAMPVISHVLPLIGQTWELQSRWLRVPRWARHLLSWDLRLRPTIYRLARWALLAVVMLLAYRGLTRSYPLTVEAPATLEPQIKRSVFATADGYVESLLVEDGQAVTVGQPVAQLKSPALDLQIEELQGQLRSLGERRSGLRVALNQIDPSARDASIQQSRLSAEIAQLVAQEANVQNQIKLLSDERKKLALTSPISGIVVSRDLKQQLLMRPVRRGDALFTVVDLEGPWQLRVEVADRDTGYVRAHLGLPKTEASPTSLAQQFEFIFDSLPEKRFQAQVEWQADTVQNRVGEGCYLEVRAKVDREVVQQSHMGASALAYFQCGQQPLWFVWSRPIVEAAQRKFWFFTEGVNNDHAN